MASLTAADASERFDFVSKTYANPREFLNDAPANELTIRAWLTLPDKAAASVPAAIIGHASDGITSDVQAMVKAVTNAGYAAIYYDSFASRGLQSVKSGGALLGGLHQAVDAYAALRYLATDRRIDLARVAYVGASVGGGAAVATASEYLRRRSVGADGPRFAAHVAFYPGFHSAPTADTLTGAPILIILGEQDDYQKPERPRAWVDFIGRTKPDAQVRIVPIQGALHSFLTDSLPARRFVSDYNNGSLCPIFLLQDAQEPQFLAIDGKVVGPPKCQTTRGGNMGYNAGAAKAGLDLMVDFLRKSFANRT